MTDHQRLLLQSVPLVTQVRAYVIHKIQISACNDQTADNLIMAVLGCQLQWRHSMLIEREEIAEERCEIKTQTSLDGKERDCGGAEEDSAEGIGCRV